MAIAAALPCLAWDRPVPYQYGRVILDNSSARAGVAPVAFNHWSHRSRFTCRLCHVDIGFAMSAGATGISASTNRGHFHCGACHNGKTAWKGRAIFASCSDAEKLDPDGVCGRCHAKPDTQNLRKEYEAFAGTMPRDAFGLINWEKAERERLVKPIDFLDGVSIRRKALEMNKDIAVGSKASWMTDVLFSHRKHAVWNGCEVCHPEIFPSTKGGDVHYTMLQINNGEYCGVCHTKVAFPIGECELCHTKSKPMR